MVSTTGGLPQGGQLPSGVIAGFDRVMAIHRPAVLAHIRAIRRRSPHATPVEIIVILERRYVAAVTTGGAAVGATAVIPGVTTGITLALSGVETAGFLEATALFTQSVSEVHGIAVADPERARALVMTMMLGHEGSELVRQLAGQATGNGAARNVYWGELVTTSLPRAIMGPLTDRLKSSFLRQFAARGGASFIGKALPFGVGAIVGGAGNNILGKRVVQTSRMAFGLPPAGFSPDLDPKMPDLVVGEGTAARRIAVFNRRTLSGLSGRLSPRRRMQPARGPQEPAGNPASGPAPV
ncbi:hypothetical protein [Cryobacterium sp. TMT2-23]|nr:hypothetical protein [Cryobacterium sp. TMT2-23]